MFQDIDPSFLDKIAQIVYQNSGIVFKESNLAVLNSRLSSKCKEKKVEPEEYLKLLNSDKEELVSFIDFVTTNFTSFFRNQRHFNIFEEEVLPIVIKKNEKSRQIRVWSAGSSTGEEAYTIAIVIHRYFIEHGIDLSQWNIHIMGSDISLDSLFIAKEGKYPYRSVQKIDPDIIKKYFIHTEDQKYYIVQNFIKEMVSFDYHNLMYDPNFGNIDIIFCRNVLIYFDESIQKKVLSKLYDAANTDAFLFVGHSESLIGIFDGFQPVSFKKGVVYAKK